MFQRFAKFLEVREATDEEVHEAFDSSLIHQPVQKSYTADTPFLQDVEEQDKLSQNQQHNLQPEMTRIFTEHSEDLRHDDNQISNDLNVTRKEEDQLSEVSLDSNPSPTDTEVPEKISSPPHTPPTTRKISPIPISYSEPPRKIPPHFDVISKPVSHYNIIPNEKSTFLRESYEPMPLETFLTSADEEIPQPTSTMDVTQPLETQLSRPIIDTTTPKVMVSFPKVIEENGQPQRNQHFFPENDKQALLNRIAFLESEHVKSEREIVELSNKLERLQSVEAQLQNSENFTKELEQKLTNFQSESEIKIKELETSVNSLTNQLLTKQAETDIVESFRNRFTALSESKTEDIVNDCAKLVKRLGRNDDSTVNEDFERAQNFGKQIAVLTSKLIAAEQQIKDEKLVLKNLFISWMERGERKDAFEILARAFDFTAEDRERLERKPSWKRGQSLGVQWPFSESFVDFVRDETN